MNIKSATYLVSSPSVEVCPRADRPEYAFIGRSNVGKSSLINMICNNQKLAKTSASPGKTQLINHFNVASEPDKGPGKEQHWYLVDLPGYGYAKVAQGKRKQWIKMIEHYIRKRDNLVNLFVLIDSRHNPQAIDLEFINQLGEWQIPFSIVFTKADKSTQKEVAAAVRDFLQALGEHWAELPPHFVTSAVKYRGRKEMLSFIESCNKDMKDRWR
ncbi:MAG TPA: ribosome biogenesis GTP-binding protein YihA/YsxC [Lacibacter sp.]|nr:ribosome biogenesis GTP-binding protein YihA/YsxC [Lacibacter sp.]HMO87929.1 ribosome biogenesis GTP-binding protein YihA/YsxC [Lacibacter sp.]HMP88049.1 ribosome biogenesis GTP-binding protein YihA/YsxC [Lacibacter sp.]